MASRTVTYVDNGTTVTLRPGAQVVVRLPEQPTTGFRWAVDQSEEALVVLVATTYVPAAGVGVGGGGEHVWTFEATHPGTGQLRLKLWRAWEGDTSVQERFAVRIQVLP